MTYYDNKPKRSFAPALWKWVTNPWCLWISAILILTLMLGAKELWTQEWRWADICQQMFLRHDFLHPYLRQMPYYDKPLLSYWLMIGMSYLTGGLNIWAIRLPSALAGLLTIWSTYFLGKRLFSKQVGVLAGWLLISTFLFIFWAHVGNSDMLNVAGTILPVAWYFYRRDNAGFFSYLVFFTMLAVASLLKGLLAPAVAIIAIIPDLIYENNWHKHLKISAVIALIFSIGIYLIPFILSNYIYPSGYKEAGLSEVFIENFLRYFRPFDHEGPIYTYFVYLPLYIFPWIFFYVPALFNTIFKWRSKAVGMRWLFWANILIFAFFTASGSRRDYYILPMIPFALLFTAAWIGEKTENFNLRKKMASYTAMIFYAITFLFFVVVIPIAYMGGGAKVLAKQVKAQAVQIKPWKDWQISALDAQNKLNFYFNSPNLIHFIDGQDDAEDKPTRATLIKSFPILLNNPNNNILVIRERYLPFIQDVLPKYTVVKEPPTLFNKLTNNKDLNGPVVLIPKTTK